MIPVTWIEGHRRDNRAPLVVADGRFMFPLPAEIDLGDNGFDWGRVDSTKPYQLAYAMLREFCEPDDARALYQDFFEEFVAGMPFGEWRIAGCEILGFLARAGVA